MDPGDARRAQGAEKTKLTREKAAAERAHKNALKAAAASASRAAANHGAGSVSVAAPAQFIAPAFASAFVHERVTEPFAALRASDATSSSVEPAAASSCARI